MHALAYIYSVYSLKALSSFVQELVQQQHRDVDRSGAREAALPLDRFDQNGRPPKGKNEGKNTAPFGPLKERGGRRRQPPPTKPRGVILPPHLRVRYMRCYHMELLCVKPLWCVMCLSFAEAH